jgi:hypothetical protein
MDEVRSESVSKPMFVEEAHTPFVDLTANAAERLEPGFFLYFNGAGSSRLP